jgi:acetylornithine aminotransferase
MEASMTHIFDIPSLLKTDFVRGEGCRLYDAQGKSYIDLESGDWAAGLGHGHPRVNRALCEQAERLIHLGDSYLAPVTEEAAAQVLEITGMPEGKCVFLNSGSEVVEFAVQAARRVSCRPLLLGLANAYLAAFGSAGKKDPAEWLLFDAQACAACPQAESCDPACPRIREIPFERVAAFVFEPGAASGQIRPPAAGPIRVLAEQVHAQGGCLAVNEVTTGMGRTGAWFGFQHYAVQPDVVGIGKILGNGYPVSAVAMRAAFAESLKESGFRYAQSHQNDPLGAAVAKEVIAVLRDEDLVARSRRLGADFLDALRVVGQHHPGVKAIRGRGMMLAIEFGPALSAAQVSQALRERGFLVEERPGANQLCLFPPLVLPEDDVTNFILALDEEMRD